MLGCHDFCGHYDWGFHYVRRRWGQEAIALLWREAIGGDSQQHYTGSQEATGLRALYNAWTKTGEDEHCDWTFTLDEEKNVLRWDMRACPSKGFLVNRDLNSDEDYCNHCMGWVIPMLGGMGAELLEHEHNHCGQCWATMRMRDRPSLPLELEIDIRRDPRWNQGYLDCWKANRPLPFSPSTSSSDAGDALEAWFCRGDSPEAENRLLVSDEDYQNGSRCPGEPAAVLIGCPPVDLATTAARFLGTEPSRRPLFLHAYLPSVPWIDFVSAGLPRPWPILPLLIRKGLYTHRPGGPHPTTAEFLAMLAHFQVTR